MYCHIKLPNQGENILYYKRDNKSFQTPHIIYAALECLLRSIKKCEPGPNKSYQVKTNVHIPSGYPLQLVRSYNENSITRYRGIDRIKIIVRALKVITTTIAKTKKATKILSSNEENLCNCSNGCHICEKDLMNTVMKIIK